MRILVTGATGQVGRWVVAALDERGAEVRQAVTPRPGRTLTADQAPFDFHDAATWPGAVQSCKAVFLLRPPAIAQVKETLNAFVDRARTEGAQHVVFLSVAGAASNPLVPHHAVEQHLRRSQTGTFTLLRPGFFAQNLETAYLEDLREDDRLYVPAGRGRVAFVDLRDVGEVAAQALLDPNRHQGQAYTLTGPARFRFAEAATLLSEALGRRIDYQPASVIGYMAHLRRRGLPLPQVLVQTVLHLGLRFGQAATVDPTLGRLLGRRPRDLADYIRDHAASLAQRPAE
ncbi:MAG TPA: NmrA family NAD(P)-binding protein [Polyangiaceae bacterium LLY-WYZ-14_1]|nr:NmrA family NAD(P)-binding protein [Polyangiaceae bacterium LLY-WYZ-14_1]